LATESFVNQSLYSKAVSIGRSTLQQTSYQTDLLSRNNPTLQKCRQVQYWTSACTGQAEGWDEQSTHRVAILHAKILSDT